MDRKTIWYISQYASPVKYGFGTRHFPLAEEWARHGHNVVIISATFNYLNHSSPPNKYIYNFEKLGNVQSCWIKVNKYEGGHSKGRILSWFVFCWWLLFFPYRKTGKPDIVIISSMSILPIINGYILKLRFGAKLIFEVRDIWPLTIMDLGGYTRSNIFIRLLSAVEKFGYTVSDYIVGTMPALDRHVKNVINKPFNFTCIPQGLDLNFVKSFQELDSAFVETYLPKDKFIVGYAGALGVSNALEPILECARKMQEKEKNIHFILLGDGNQRKKLIKLAKGLDNITFAPKIKKVLVNSYLQKCDLLYDSISTASIYDYGLSPNKWIDYMYSGRPMVVSHSGYLSMINEAESGTAVAAGDVDALVDEILKYYKMDADKLTEIGQRGRAFLIKYRKFEKLAVDYEKLF